MMKKDNDSLTLVTIISAIFAAILIGALAWYIVSGSVFWTQVALAVLGLSIIGNAVQYYTYRKEKKNE